MELDVSTRNGWSETSDQSAWYLHTDDLSPRPTGEVHEIFQRDFPRMTGSVNVTELILPGGVSV